MEYYVAVKYTGDVYVLIWKGIYDIKWKKQELQNFRLSSTLY